MQTRALATEILLQLCKERLPLDQLLDSRLDDIDNNRDRAFVQDLCFGVMRWFPRLDWYLEQLLDKPIRNKNLKLRILCWVGIYQLALQRTADHGAVSTTVSACNELSLQWARGMVNAILRNFLRRRQELDSSIASDESAKFAHPAWLIDAIRQDWPSRPEEILEANNKAAPMILRVNVQKSSRSDYRLKLNEQNIPASEFAGNDVGLILEKPVDVNRLPGFHEGLVSVQDGAAQLAARFLQLEPGQRVLDACAAPGGKTCHILESEPDLAKVIAVDSKPGRMAKVQQNLDRLLLQADTITADVTDTGMWWDGLPFDRILVDAPCSATGVIRRHPDIKYLRQPEDVGKICQAQMEILDSLWPLLAHGGKLLYATCSILQRENDDIISHFLERTEHAQVDNIDENCPGIKTHHGRQILSGEDHLDGFYYARLMKPENDNQN